jgi:hypothetical protein
LVFESGEDCEGVSVSVHEIGNQFHVFRRGLEQLEKAVEGLPVNNALSACLELAVRLAQKESGLQDRSEAIAYLKEEIESLQKTEMLLNA